MVHYENEWENTARNTGYPFITIPSFGSSFITAFTTNFTTPVFLKRIVRTPLTIEIFFARTNDDVEVLKTEMLPYVSGVYKVNNIYNGKLNGFVEVLDPLKNILKTETFEKKETTLHYSCNSFYNTTQTINTFSGEIEVEAGYNCLINGAKIFPELARGKGEFCGQPIFLDDIYSINGASPDDKGNIEFTTERHFTINLGTNKIIMGLSIPEGRLLCERTFGVKGDDGVKGATGPDGFPGEDAFPFDLLDSFNNSIGGCCECDAVDDKQSSGDAEKTSLEEKLKEIGMSSEEFSNLTPEQILEIIGEV